MHLTIVEVDNVSFLSTGWPGYKPLFRNAQHKRGNIWEQEEAGRNWRRLSNTGECFFLRQQPEMSLETQPHLIFNCLCFSIYVLLNKARGRQKSKDDDDDDALTLLNLLGPWADEELSAGILNAESKKM